MSSRTDLGAQYREAKAAVAEHTRRWVDAELAVIDHVRTRRGAPSAGDPILADLQAKLDQAEADYRWCRALVIACGEQIKGASFDEVLAAQGPREVQP